MAVAEQVYPHLPVARTAWAIRPHEEEITRQINGSPALLLEWLEDPAFVAVWMFRRLVEHGR